MRIVCAPDSFKESMTSIEAAQALARGIRSVDPTIECDLVPMADGGEGTVDALVTALDGEWVEAPCHDALNRPVTGRFGIVPERRLAIIEVAEAVGLAKIDPAHRDPWASTSRGAGELILAALDRGAVQFVVGLGGSATNDAGAGMLTALGAQFFDCDGQSIPWGAKGLLALDSMNPGHIDSRLPHIQISDRGGRLKPAARRAWCLCGLWTAKGRHHRRCAAVGRCVDPMGRRRRIDHCPTSARTSRAGSAGGLGAAFMAFTDATVESGVELVMDAVGLLDRMVGADWVFTGEGGIDSQTSSGKTPWGVAHGARNAGVRSILFGGRVSDDAYELVGDAVAAVVPILPKACDLTTALNEGAANLERAAAMVTRLLLAASR